MVVLIASVGGSPAPIRTALARLRPDGVLFVVSPRQGEAPGSIDTVDGAVSDYGGPGLRHGDGCPPDVRTLAVPPDDPDRAFALIESEIGRLVDRGVDIVADYTGGTKSMAMALFLAATAYKGVRVQFMAGTRPDLKQVEDGTEAPAEQLVHLVGISLDMQTAQGFVARQDYAAARALLRRVERRIVDTKTRPPRTWRRRLAFWREWLDLLDAWDRFDHRGAYRLWINGGETTVAAAHALGTPDLGGRLARLNEAEGLPTPELCEDLWLNAKRRAAQGRFDDAVARCYRLVEAAAQARLLTLHGIDSGAVPRTLVPDRPPLAEGEDPETVKLGLAGTVELLGELSPNDPTVGVLSEGPIPWTSLRNNSILAHGFRRLEEHDWKVVEAWVAARRGHLWERSLGRPTAPQLPDVLPTLL